MRDDLESEEDRVQAAADGVVRNLRRGFGHSEHDARALFAAFHHYYSTSGGWPPADYYDHETPAAIAIEIQFHYLFPNLDRRGEEFLEWRKAQWKNVSTRP
jgi:hypothetical protein